MKTAPMKNVTANQNRRPPTSPRSAANTPSWQVTLESTRMIVNGAAVLRSSTTPLAGQIGSLTARIVKYIANSAAKNISSLDSHTMVPTLTTLGLVSDPCDGTFSRAVAEATRRFLQPEQALCRTTPRLRASAFVIMAVAVANGDGRSLVSVYDGPPALTWGRLVTAWEP